jgi:Protein of unknown function (DUF2924)
MSPLALEIATLHGATTRELKIAWRHLYRSQPPCMTRDLMIRAIAYRMQERAHGGLAPATKRRLRSLVTAIEAKGMQVFDPGIVLKPGVRLMREWAGQTHTVIVFEHGFDYAGESYPSLSKIAAKITGAHWSGPRFFGIRKTASRAPAPAEAGHG